MDNYITQRALAQLHRQKYDADAMARAKEADAGGQFNEAMFPPSVMAQRTLGAADSQADYAPQWDAFFNATEGDNPAGASFAGSPDLPDDTFGSLAGLKKATKR